MYGKFYSESLVNQAYYKKKIAKSDGKVQYIVGKHGTDQSNLRMVIYDVSYGVKFTCSCYV